MMSDIDKDKEKLSAFMDGEMDTSSKHIVPQLVRDAELQASWSRYHLISDCLKQQMPAYFDTELANHVSQALADEPVVLAPVRKSQTHALFKPVAGFAIAASVAAVAILGIQQPVKENHLQTDKAGLAYHTPTAAAAPDAAIAVPVRQVSSVRHRAANASGNASGNVSSGSRHDILDRYLVNHNEQHADSGMLPYARVLIDEKQQ